MTTNGGATALSYVRRPSQLSKRGVLVVSHFEGFVAYPYNDGASNATIGFGHLLHLGPVTDEDVRRWHNGIGRGYALDLLRADARTAARIVSLYVAPRVSQCRFDALTDAVYNCGETILRGTNVARYVNTQRWSEAAAYLREWDHDSRGNIEPGLVARRDTEATMLIDDKYPPFA